MHPGALKFHVDNNNALVTQNSQIDFLRFQNSSGNAIVVTQKSKIDLDKNENRIPRFDWSTDYLIARDWSISTLDFCLP